MRNGGLTLEGYKAEITRQFMDGISTPEVKAEATKYLASKAKDIEADYKWYLDGSAQASPNAVASELDLDFVADEWT